MKRARGRRSRVGGRQLGVHGRVVAVLPGRARSARRAPGRRACGARRPPSPTTKAKPHRASTASRRCSRARATRRAGSRRGGGCRPVRGGGRSPRPGPPADLCCVPKSPRRVACATRPVTAVDWIIVALTLADGDRGLRPGLRGRRATLAGFAGGLFVGARIGPALLSAGSHVALRAALRAHGRAHRREAVPARLLEALGYGLRRKLSGPSARAGRRARSARSSARASRSGSRGSPAPSRSRRPGARPAATTSSARASCARSTARCRPRGRSSTRWRASIPSRTSTGRGRPAGAARGDRARPRRARRVARRGQDPGDRVRAGGRGLGLGRPRRRRRDQRPRRRRRRTTRRSSWAATGPRLSTRAGRLRPRATTSRSCAWRAAAAARCRSPPTRAAGRRAAILGFPENGPYDVRAGRVGATREVLTQDAYGDGPVQRAIVTLRGTVRPGNSGGPLVDARGRVWRPSSRPRRGGTPRRLRGAQFRRRASALRQAGATGLPVSHRARDARQLSSPALARRPDGQDPRHRREAVRGPGPGARPARPLREAQRRGGEDRALARGPRARHHVGRRPPRAARRARRVRRQVQEVAHGRPADRARARSSSSSATSARRSR